MVDGVARSVWESRRSFVKQQICGISVDVASANFTYKAASKIIMRHPDTGEMFKPFLGFVTVSV